MLFIGETSTRVVHLLRSFCPDRLLPSWTSAGSWLPASMPGSVGQR